MRSPAAISNALLAVGVQQQDLQLAAIARVDEAGRVDERDPVARGEAGARQHEPGVARRGSSIAMPVATVARAPGSSRAACSACRS